MPNNSGRSRVRRASGLSLRRRVTEKQQLPEDGEADAVRDAFLRGAGMGPGPLWSALSRADQMTRARAVGQLQQERGNSYVQRVVQRQDQPARGAQPAFNPLDPAVLTAAARQVVDANQAPVRRWLGANTSRLRLATLGEIVVLARREVPQAGRLADAEIQSLAREWASREGFTNPPGPVQPPARPGPSPQIPDAVRRAFSIAVEGVDVACFPNGRVNIAVSGATAQLGASTLSVGWGGSLGIELPAQGFHLSGKLSKDRWEVTLSIPGGSSMPDLSQLADVFQRAERAVRGIVAATAEFQNLDDVAAVQAAISPHIKPVKEAVDVLQAIAGAPQVSVGITAGGPVAEGERAPGTAAEAPEGVSITATLTIRF